MWHLKVGNFLLIQSSVIMYAIVCRLLRVQVVNSPKTLPCLESPLCVLMFKRRASRVHFLFKLCNPNMGLPSGFWCGDPCCSLARAVGEVYIKVSCHDKPKSGTNLVCMRWPSLYCRCALNCCVVARAVVLGVFWTFIQPALGSFPRRLLLAATFALTFWM